MDWIVIDEKTEVTEEMYHYIQERMNKALIADVESRLASVSRTSKWGAKRRLYMKLERNSG